MTKHLVAVAVSFSFFRFTRLELRDELYDGYIFFLEIPSSYFGIWQRSLYTTISMLSFLVYEYLLFIMPLLLSELAVTWVPASA